MSFGIKASKELEEKAGLIADDIKALYAGHELTSEDIQHVLQHLGEELAK